MIKLIKRILLLLWLLSIGNFTFALSSDYYPNYQIQTSWDSIIDNMSNIKAYKNTWENIPSSMFSQLNSDFQKVFPYFPQKPDYKIIYKQCLLTTQSLASKYTYDRYLDFEDRCFDPVNSIIQDIKRLYTVKAVISAKPKSGSAPLTVTFDGRWSEDPANETIPESNYYWYFKDANGVDRKIGQWAVVNYTFTQSWNYKVHLTVRSAMSKDSWIFDGEETITVNVEPKSAILSVYIWWKKLDTDYEVKLWTEQAKKWVLIDGSGTNPTWWRKILSHRWEIKWVDNWFSYIKKWDWTPRSFTLSLTAKWEYNLSLIVQDNEWNEIREKYLFRVSDPVATIKFSPEEWNTSSKYDFDASPSYSVQSKIKTYKWTIYDPDGKIIDNYESKGFKREFLKPWTYSVKLTVIDEIGVSSDDDVKFYVDSTAPVAQFTKTGLYRRKNPSQYILDASSSFDVDQMNGMDNIKYSWKFSDAGNVVIDKNIDDGKKIYVSFNQKWTYKVSLEVTDSFGKITEIVKNIEIKSALRPELTADKVTAIWWDSITFSVKSNKTISYYEWDFGDGTKANTSVWKVSHIYKKVWVYTVKLKVKTPSGNDENEVYSNVYIGEKWSPIVWYLVKSSTDVIATPDDICVIEEWWKKKDVKSYGIDRKVDFVLDGSVSVNSKWERSWLKIYYNPQNDEILTRNPLNYNFSEVGCQYIDISIEDTANSKTAKERVRFKVKNAKPTIWTVLLTFPQYGNETWIWFNQTQKSKSMFSVEYDPLIVKVSANGVKDPDGFVSHYVWYYYQTDNPDRLLEVKITPYNIPYWIFSIPRVPWEYAFGVKVVDNEWWEITSEEILGQWPVVFFKNDASTDIAIVTLAISPINTEVGEKVEFKAVSKIVSDRKDFASSRIIKYDFDGDGQYDLTTKKPVVEYIYNKPGKYKPKVKVIYRWYAWIAYGEMIEVKEWLKPQVLTTSYDKLVLVRDISYWSIEKRQYCMDVKQCSKIKKYNISDKDFFTFKYDDYDNFKGSLKVSDKYWNEKLAVLDLNISKPKGTEKFSILSLPEIDKKDDNYSIDVGNNLDNSVLFYVYNQNKWDCYLDYDITTDSDGDGNPEWDKDLKCNTAELHKYDPVNGNIVARAYYTDSKWKSVKKDIDIKFIDIWDNVPEKYKDVYEKLNKVIDALKSSKDDNVAYLKTLLVNLRKVLWEDTERDSLLVQINDWMDTQAKSDNASDVEQSVLDQINEIIQELADGSVKAAMTMNQYEIAKADILTFIPDAVRDSVKELFTKIEWAGGKQEDIKGYLNQILDIAKDQKQKWNMDDTDFNVVLNDLCSIMDYYGIQSETCNKDITASQPKTSVFGTIVKIVLYVVWFMVLAFIIIIVVFAIKAKKQQQQDLLWFKENTSLWWKSNSLSGSDKSKTPLTPKSSTNLHDSKSNEKKPDNTSLNPPSSSPSKS